MNFKILKTILLMNSWLIARGLPVAMMQHARSSQSIVFHQVNAAVSETTSSPVISSTGYHQPKYEYKYEVSDHQTGDRKSHWEKRDGDNVRGIYTLYEPDGAQRIVEYTADALHGFTAVVKNNKPKRYQQHQDGAYLGGMPSTGSISYTSERNEFSNQENRANLSRATHSLNQGVDFSVIH